MKVRVLGCGMSAGVPSLQDGWGSCNPDNPKNKRSRSSILLEKDGFHLLIDASPEVRLQLIDAGYPKIDAVLLTHMHADHVGGMDDLRCFTWEKSLPVFINKQEIKEFKYRLNYVFEVSENNKEFVPKFDLFPIEKEKKFQIGPFSIYPITQNHGPCESLGVRIGNFSYNTDVIKLQEDGFESLKGIETLILGCSSTKKTKKHLDLKTAIQWIERIKPKKAYLTHMGADMDYETLKRILPPHIEPAYDGLEFEV